MRDYAKIGCGFWFSPTGKALRKRGEQAIISAVYLISSPHSNMLGLYVQVIPYMGHETGLGEERAWKGLQDCIDVGFCSYDRDSEMVWVHEMAAWQIADELKANDLRCKGIQKDYEQLPRCPFLGPFFDRYAKAFHLTGRRTGEPDEPTPGALLGQGPSKGGQQAPTKPGTGTGAGTSSGTGARAGTLSLVVPPIAGTTPELLPPEPAAPAAPVPPAPKPPAARKPKAPDEEKPTVPTWEAYSAGFEHRYGHAPLRNAAINGKLAQFLKKVPAEDAPQVAAFYVTHNQSLYVSSKHAVDLLLRDAEKLWSDWKAGSTTAGAPVRSHDETAARADRVARLAGYSGPAEGEIIDA